MEITPSSSTDDPPPDTTTTSTASSKHVYGVIQTPGSTCTGGVASMLPCLPGLNVQGVGNIPLPLNNTTAATLKTVAKQQTPYGHGMQTVVDTTSIRNTLQIHADQISFTNPAWKENLDKLTRQVAVALGASNPVQARLYKMLLHETGGIFKTPTHKDDSEKEHGMFATLVVQLPSIFTGGALVVKHNNKDAARTFPMDTPSIAPYSCQYVAHCADCDHEILPVESGHRLTLTRALLLHG
ncbi:MAG: hypothetical protein SGARI_007735 [Bacillariaceae sp.]